MSNVIKLEITNDSYKKFNHIQLFITEDLKNELEKTPNKKYENLYKKIQVAGFRGGKHLIETIVNRLGNKVKIIFSDRNTEINEDSVFINYQSYRKTGSSLFYEVYRQAGMMTAYKFLSNKLPSLAPNISTTITKTQVQNVIISIPETKVITNKTQALLLTNVAKMVRDSGISPKKFSLESLKEISAATNQAYYKKRLIEFKERLLKKISETKGKNSWQKWIYENIWLFGNGYLEPIEKQKIGLDQIPDFLFPTVDGFLDILEIKVPHDIEIIKPDNSHKGSFYWSTDTSKTIGQVTNYLHVLEENQLKIAQIIRRVYENKYPLEISTVKPRAIILLGRAEGWDNTKREGLRKLNFTLHSIEILSYDHLINRGESLISMFEKRY
jgi:hypothetical protein